MAFASRSAHEPLGEINTTPLIDVMLVVLVMLIFTIPMATNSLEIEVPSGEIGDPNPIKNVLVVTASDRLLWNGSPVSDRQLGAVLLEVRQMDPEPEVQFRPHAQARYERTAKVMQIVKASRITRFGFSGNEAYRQFSR